MTVDVFAKPSELMEYDGSCKAGRQQATGEALRAALQRVPQGPTHQRTEVLEY